MAVLSQVRADAMSLPSEERKQLAIEAGGSLNSEEKQDLRAALGGPTQGVTDKIWMVVVIAFVIVFVGAFGAIAYYYTNEKANLDKLITVFSTVSAFLAGLLVPSPIANRQ